MLQHENAEIASRWLENRQYFQTDEQILEMGRSPNRPDLAKGAKKLHAAIVIAERFLAWANGVRDPFAVAVASAAIAEMRSSANGFDDRVKYATELLADFAVVCDTGDWELLDAVEYPPKSASAKPPALTARRKSKHSSACDPCLCERFRANRG